MSEPILVECDCAPEYSHHCYKCGGTGLRPAPVPTPTQGILKVNTTDSPLSMDANGKVLAHLTKDEIQTIAKAVCDELERRKENDDDSSVLLEQAYGGVR